MSLPVILLVGLLADEAVEVTPTEPRPVKCVAHHECSGAQVCIDYMCVAPPPKASPDQIAPVPPEVPATGGGVRAVREPAAIPPHAPSPAIVAAPHVARATESAKSMPRVDVPAAPEVTDPLDDGGFVLSIERLFGAYAWSNTTQVDGVDTDSTSGSSISLLWGTASPDSVPAMAHHLPRLGLDYGFGSLTVGVTLGLFSASSTEEESDGEIDSGPDLSLFAISPRVGYVFRLGRRVLLWPRVGVGYHAFSETDLSGDVEETLSMSGWGVGIEGTLGYRATGSLAFIASLCVDLPLSGAVTQEPAAEQSAATSVFARSLGVGAGVMIVF